MRRSMVFIFVMAVIIAGCNDSRDERKESGTSQDTVPVDTIVAIDTVVIDSIYDQPVPDTIDRKLIPGNHLTILTMGQSNAANSGNARYSPTNPVFAWYNHRYYAGNDPLVGSNGPGGSTWSRLADLLIDQGHSDAVILVPIAYGPSTIAEWSGGRLADTLRRTLHRLDSMGLKLDYILWHQGESDNEAETSTEEYIAHFDTIITQIRSYTNAPMLVAQASYYPNDSGRTVDEDILKAQWKVIQKYPNVHAGPNTDKLRGANRYDGVHFSEEGMQRHSIMWLESLRSLH